jgi:hypothetical protein
MLIEGSMWSVAVVVLDKLGQDVGELARSGDEDVVEAFASQGADPALGDRVRPRGLRWRLDDADLGGAEDGVEGTGELRVSADEETKLLGAVALRSMRRFRACWVTQGPVGWAVIPATCTRRVPCSMTIST